MKAFLYIFCLTFLFAFAQNHALAQKKTKFKKFKKAKKGEKAQLAEYAFAEGMKNYILGKHQDALNYFEESKKLNGDNAALNYITGKIYYEKEKLDLALQYASKAVKLDGKNKYYYILLAEIYEGQRNYTEALKVYKKLIAEIPKSEEYYYQVGDIYYFQKNHDEALKTYEKIENVFGKSLPITQRKQDIHLRTGNLDLAVKEGEDLIKAYPDDTEYKVSQAEFYFNNKMTEQAIAMLESVLKEEPTNSYARLLLSDIYQKTGNREKSDEALEAVFNNPETELDAKINIIIGYLQARETEHNKQKVLKLAEATIKAHPSESKAHMVYGDVLMKQGRKEDAWKAYITAKNLDNGNYNLWVQLLVMDSELNKPDSMIAHSEEALETFPNQSVIWLYNGLGYGMKKNHTKAIEVLEEGKKLAGTDQEMQSQFSIQLADNYHHLKEYQKSDAAFEEVLRIDGSNDHALNNYSYFLSLRKEKLDLAKSMSEKLAKKYPDNPTYLDTYAWVLYQMKNYEEAKKYLEMAITYSDNGTILEHYGDTLYQLGQKDLALDQWKKAKKLGETSNLIDKKIADKKLYE